jgi:hypothetical protein
MDEKGLFRDIMSLWLCTPKEIFEEDSARRLKVSGNQLIGSPKASSPDERFRLLGRIPEQHQRLEAGR